MMDRLCRFQI